MMEVEMELVEIKVEMMVVEEIEMVENLSVLLCKLRANKFKNHC